MVESRGAPDGAQGAAGSPSGRAHLTVEERVELGRAARRAVPRSSHADVVLDGDRADPVDLLQRQAASRVPELIPIRYGRMLVSPFTFYRGAALIMAADLARTPNSGFRTQVCGDAHLMNFGAFGSPDRRLVFDINDFDETAPGPWEWDVKRLATSFELAGRDNDYSDKERRQVQLAVVGAYRSTMRDFASKPNLAVWYARLEVEPLLAELSESAGSAARKRATRNLAKARTRDSMHALDKLTEVVDGTRRIISDPPLVEPTEDLLDHMDRRDLMAELQKMLDLYGASLQPDRRHLLKDFELHQVARKVVGVGSVGTRAWILLLFGRDGDDPLFLQAKEAQPSVLEEFVGSSGSASNGERVVRGQHLMQATSDIFLGWQTVDGVDGVRHDYFVRQLKDWKASAEVEAMKPSAMEIYARMCGWTLARAHARSGDRIAIASYLGGGDNFDRAIAAFSDAYADQNERDYDALVRAEREGRITVERGI